jgi:uncharacterized Zn finger protein (UPF0148 family)
VTDTAHCPNCGTPLPFYWSQYLQTGFYRCTACNPKRRVIRVHLVKREPPKPQPTRVRHIDVQRHNEVIQRALLNQRGRA